MLIQIPRCEIGAELGQGAHSVVYRAELDGVACALKVLRKRGSFARWVYREAVALARVRDPALPRVLEVGEADGLPYLAMELVEGETLASRLSAGTLAEAAALQVTERLLHALASVHSAGLVHRDVKPRNVVLEASGALKLVDFGFATPFERSSDVFELAGTRGYAAPEQFRSNARIDGRADLYAVGVVLFECLTGALPYEPVGGSPMADVSELPVRVAQLAAGLLASDPERRYPDARAALADLERVRAGKNALGPNAYEAAPATPHLVGRHAELLRIRARLAAVPGGPGVVIVVDGPSGCGKTRLLDAARSSWRDMTLGKSIATQSRDGDPPLALLRKILEGFAHGDVSADGRSRNRAELHAAAGSDLGSLVALVAPELAREIGIANTPAGSSAPAAFAEGAVELLVRLAREAGPLLIVVDDLQWTDPASRDVLVRLAHRVAEVPLALVLAARQGDRASAAFERLASLDRARFERIQPAPLSGRDIEALIATHLGNSDIDVTLVRAVQSLADTTPLNALEVLRAFLDNGALRPKGGAWRFDPARAERVALPHGAVAGLDRRMAELPPATRSVLEHAAVIGARFEDDLVARVLGIPLDDLGFALADARRAALIQSDEPGHHRFVHDSVRDLLLRKLAAHLKRSIHQRIAEELERDAPTSHAALCALALHYAEGELEKAPLRAATAARVAGDSALARFDNEAALEFFAVAQKASQVAGTELPPAFDRSVGEARLRMGALDESIAAFGTALERTSGRVERGEILGRIAWVHQAASRAPEAWATLELAFQAIGEHMPVEKPLSVGATLVHAARWGARRSRQHGATEPAATVALLSQLNYQNARLGFEHGRPLRAVQSTLHALELAQAQGSSTQQARALALLGLVLTAATRGQRGPSTLADAQAMASSVGDSVTVSFCIQLRTLASCFAGEFDAALQAFDEGLRKRGHWLELTEFCLNAGNADLIDAVRGRPRQAWAWVQLATERVRRSEHIPPVFRDNLVFRVRADRAALGRDPDGDGHDTWLSGELRACALNEPPLGSVHRMAAWGPRARALLEIGQLNEPLEALVAAFQKEAINPRFAHPMLAEYYIAVAHARVELCLRSPSAAHARADLERALGDLRASARLPLFKAHRLLVEAWAAWFAGRAEEAAGLGQQAEALALKQTCPWVLSGVARLRAHMLRAEGLVDSAQDQAKVAAGLATEHGAEPRAALIRAEFGLTQPTARRPSEHESSRSSRSLHSRKQLTALLAVVRAGVRDLRPEPQAIAILDELLAALDASRATLWFQPDLGRRSKLVIGRSRDDKTWYGVDGFRDALLKRLIDADTLVEEAQPADGHAMIALSISLYGRPAGALCIEREAGPPFDADARALLDVLLHQVPIALELASLLAERERLQASLQRAQKMEAVGRLAGGVAHDFNNMLGVIRGSLEALSRQVGDMERPARWIASISQATERAIQLTRQLLTFSAHRPTKAAACSVGQVIAGIEPMLTTVLGKSIDLEIRLCDESDLVRADRGAMEQAVVNLAVNARDAMPDGGTLRIATHIESVEDKSGPSNGQRFVAISVADNGEGMSEETLERIFEPFFTTKPEGVGTGLGLTTVYAFAKGADGHVDVTSELGKGTTFRILLPTTVAPPPQLTVASPSVEPAKATDPPPGSKRQAVLIVDDEDLIRSYLGRLLRDRGYNVFAASSGVEALDILRDHDEKIGLALVDVRMPGMSGPALVKRLRAMNVAFRIVFMTGFTAEPVADTEQLEVSQVLEKPFSSEVLLACIEASLGSVSGARSSV